MPFVNSSPIKLFGPIFNRSFLLGQTSHLTGDSYPSLSRLFVFWVPLFSHQILPTIFLMLSQSSIFRLLFAHLCPWAPIFGRRNAFGSHRFTFHNRSIQKATFHLLRWPYYHRKRSGPRFPGVVSEATISRYSSSLLKFYVSLWAFPSRRFGQLSFYPFYCY